jgi:multiple sugar transport system substrate-binding protein
MNRHKVWVVSISLLAFGVLILSACQAAPGQPPAEPLTPTVEDPTQEPLEPVTIVHWQHHSDSRAAILESLISDFRASNPNINVKFESIPYGAYWEKLAPSLEAGSGPDVFQLPGNIVFEFVERGQLTPVPEVVMSASEVEDSFEGWTVQLLRTNNQYYGLPTDVQTFLLFYNDDLFEEAGLDPSKDFETWEEFRQAAIQLTKYEGDTMVQAGLDITASPYQWYWSIPLQVFDEGIVDSDSLQVAYNSQPGYEMWKFLTDLVLVDKVDSPEFLAEQNKFLVGRAGTNLHEYFFAGSLKISAPDLNFSLHFPPMPPDRPKRIGGTHWAYVVSSQTNHPEAAWEWVKFITSEPAQRKWVAEGGEIPSRKGLLDDPAMKSDPIVAVGVESMKYAVPFDSYGWDDVWYVHQAIWDEVVLEGKDVETAVDSAAQKEENLYKTKGLTP